MPRRVRSILIDSTQNRILTEVESSVSVALDKIIAKSNKQFITYNPIGSGKTNVVAVAANIGNGYKFISAALITGIKLSAVTASTSGPVTIRLKKGTDSIYANATTLQDFSLVSSSKNVSHATTITIAAGEIVYVDITAKGLAAAQLTITIEYYS